MSEYRIDEFVVKKDHMLNDPYLDERLKWGVFWGDVNYVQYIKKLRRDIEKDIRQINEPLLIKHLAKAPVERRDFGENGEFQYEVAHGAGMVKFVENMYVLRNYGSEKMSLTGTSYSHVLVAVAAMFTATVHYIKIEGLPRRGYSTLQTRFWKRRESK